MFSFVCCGAEEGGGKVHTLTFDEEHAEASVECAQTEPVLYQSSCFRQSADAKAFVLVVQREHLNAPLGALLDPAGTNSIHVSRLLPGENPISMVNQMVANKDSRLEVGDFITQVNDVAGDVPSMLKEIQTNRRVVLLISRPLTYSITVNRMGGVLGCAVKYDANVGTSLMVESLGDGPLRAWNEGGAKAGGRRTVREGDRIVAVAGRGGTALDLLDYLQGAEGHGDVEITFSRPASF